MIFKKVRPEQSPVLFFSKYRSLAPYIGAMAKFESGNYSNRLSREYNNIFSMTTPRIRKQVSAGSTGNLSDIDNQTVSWQIYDSYSQAIEDLILWFDATKFPSNVPSVDLFVKELKNRGYFTADYFHYLNGVKKYL